MDEYQLNSVSWEEIIEMKGFVEKLKKEMKRYLEKREEKMKGLEEERKACLMAIEADDRQHTADTAFMAADALGKFAYAAAHTYEKEGEELPNYILDIIFGLKYREVFGHAPEMPEEKIRHFCQVLIRLLPYMSTSPQEIRKFAYADFICIYTDGVDGTVSSWCSSDKKAEAMYEAAQAEYLSSPNVVQVEILEFCLLNTLTKLLYIDNVSDDTDKKGFFLDLHRLSGLFQAVYYVFSKWVDEEEMEGLPYYSIYKIGSWIPDFLRDPWFS